METRECEVKYAVTPADRKRVQALLKKEGFTPHPEQLETDFIPDTSDFKCRQNKLLLRFRHIVTPKTADILLTLKMGKNIELGFQDARELQYPFSQVRPDIFARINEILEAATSKTLPHDIHTLGEIRHIRAKMHALGFPALRTLIQKKRTIYSRGNRHVTFDTFPEGIGKYMEIETETPEELDEMMKKLRMPRDKVELRDYGDLVKAKKEGQSEEEKRIALFPRSRKQIWKK